MATAIVNPPARTMRRLVRLRGTATTLIVMGTGGGRSALPGRKPAAASYVDRVDHVSRRRRRWITGSRAALTLLLGATAATAADAGREQPVAVASASSQTYSSCGDGEEESLSRNGLLGTDATTARAERHLAQSDPYTGEPVIDLETRSRLHTATEAQRGGLAAIDLRGRVVAQAERHDVVSDCTGASVAAAELAAPLTLSGRTVIKVSWSVSGPRHLQLTIHDNGRNRDYTVIDQGDDRRGEAVVRLGRGSYELQSRYAVGVDVEDGLVGVRRQTGTAQVGIRIRPS